MRAALFRPVAVPSAARAYHDYYTAKSTKGGTLRLHLARARQLVGVRSTRGTREYNEDRYRAVTLELPDAEYEGSPLKEANRAYFGMFDGHGGSHVADWLAANLHRRIESVTATDLPPTLSDLRDLGGYFRRFPAPPILAPLLETLRKESTMADKIELTLEQRLTLAYLRSDVDCMRSLQPGIIDGSTASVVIVEPKDGSPFWESDLLEVVVGHAGDSRIILCDVPTGLAIPLTTLDHHPGATSEHERLRKYASFVTTDSWGDERILGTLQISRAVGDRRMKKFGVSAEPDVTSRTVTGAEAAFLVLVTDGVTSVMTNQEIVDIVKQHDDPTTAATKLVDAADELGTEDNCTAMIVRLPGWGTPMPDLTKELRKYRADNESTMASRQTW
ncbi:phosphatase 2C-like domain-containing protein [Endogone sp. FLAS-F59071]|nr:phosphatase 2C-like domain-containing protein [Endogone sp. FLAS-F59071]|eukprot:RUS16752.1 phosphatase 2C-like domain-containing protein [Endogone sp. FLAS-F59071]